MSRVVSLGSHNLNSPFCEQATVQDGGAKPPEFTDLYTGNLAVARHFLESLGMDFQQCGCFIAIEQLLKSNFRDFRPVGWFGNKAGHCCLRKYCFAASKLPELFEGTFRHAEESNSFTERAYEQQE